MQAKTVGAVLLSAIALVAACSSDDSAIPPPGTDAGSSGTTDGSSNQPDGSTDGSDTKDSGPVAPVVDADCAAFADAYCDLLQRCYPILLGGLSSDLATCKARAGLGCAISVQAPGAAKPPLACSTALKAATCSSHITDIDPSCHVKGTLADGSSCEYDGQCQSGSCPKRGLTGPCYTCTARAIDGASCQQADCDYDLQCAEGTCVKPVAQNGACTKGKCAPPNRCVAGCQTPKARGATCTPAPGNADDPCDAVNGDYCKPGIGAPNTGTCTAIVFVDPGASCGVVAGVGLVGCKGSAACKAGKCVANAADGAACNTTSGPECTGPAECLNGVCTFPNPARCK